MAIYPKYLDALLPKENQYFLQAAAGSDQSFIFCSKFYECVFNKDLLYHTLDRLNAIYQY